MHVLRQLLNQENINYLSMVFPVALPLIGMGFVVAMDSFLSPKQKTVFYMIFTLALCLIIQNGISSQQFDGQQSILLQTAISAFGYSIRPVCLALFLLIVDPDRKYLLEWILIASNAVLYATAFFSPLTFYYLENGVWVSGPFRDACLYLSIFLFGELVYRIVRKYGKIRKREMLVPLFCVLIIACSVLLDYSLGIVKQVVSFLTIAIVTSSLLFYIWIHLQFVREHEEDLKARQRIQIMVSQIQPHFLYNTLSTIQAMCVTDPMGAKDTIEKFGIYLRQNIDSLSQAELIPVQKELEHTHIYAEIEMVRYENVMVEFDTPDLGFSLPTLTIQPLVENAIRHGVRIRENGLVTVRTRKKEGYHEIVVEDNGKGFDTGLIVHFDEEHIGLKNVRERIEKLCGGSMHIESCIGEGTVITIHIPERLRKERRGGLEGGLE